MKENRALSSVLPYNLSHMTFTSFNLQWMVLLLDISLAKTFTFNYLIFDEVVWKSVIQFSSMVLFL